MAELKDEKPGGLMPGIISGSPNGSDITQILRDFAGDPQKADGVARFLGFDPIPNPEDQLSGPLTAGLRQFFGRSDDKFGVQQLYRIGTVQAHPGSAGLWISVLSNWGDRPSDRDRSRRQIARALATEIPERRSLAFLVPPAGDGREEAELIFPRMVLRDSHDPTIQSVTSIRAFIELNDPTRFHRDLLYELRVPHGASLTDISRLWSDKFSVERVTAQFYKEYVDVRNRMAEVLINSNQGHAVVQKMSDDEAKTWATRQMGRVLFLWFLQAKRWRGQPGGNGSATYLLDLWHKRLDTTEQEYYQGILEPLFFEALGAGTSSGSANHLLGYIPYLNGGLFRRSRQEDAMNDVSRVSLPDEVFDPNKTDSLLSLLLRYRFTTRESTPDDQSVDPDPELLGRVFENLHQDNERHDTGTYYTPREIVQFMCREVIDGYLKDNTEVDQTTLNHLREQSVGSFVTPVTLDRTLEGKLANALEAVRVCDPAVGSGAFLVGVIQEIVLLRRGMLFSRQDFVADGELYDSITSWKRHTIQNSLYGVDINPEAVEICRLRLWLSLVLDMTEPPTRDSEWALPNLDFRIVAGDSLIDRVAGVAFKESLPRPEGLNMDFILRGKLESMEGEISDSKQEFQGIRRNPARLRELRDNVAILQAKIIRLHLEEGIRRLKHNIWPENKTPNKIQGRGKTQSRISEIEALILNLDSWDFAMVQKPFLWPTAFPEVLGSENPDSGFDIVLANPPYVDHRIIPSLEKDIFDESFGDFYVKTGDLLTCFVSRGLQILKPGGWYSFLTSNKYMRGDFGKKIRDRLPKQSTIHTVIDFADLPIFIEGNNNPVAAYPAIVTVQNVIDGSGNFPTVADVSRSIARAIREEQQSVNHTSVRSQLELLDYHVFKTAASDYPQALLRRDGWILETTQVANLFFELLSAGPLFGEQFKNRFHRGITTGADAAFVINEHTRRRLVDEDPGCASLISPLLRGGDIKRWHTEEATDYIITLQNSGDKTCNNVWSSANSENEAFDIFRNQYPSLARHFQDCEKLLQQEGKSLLTRSDRGTYWWELRPCSYYSEFALPKILWAKTATTPRFAYNLTGEFLASTVNCLTGVGPWVTAIMNSSVMEFMAVLRINLLRGASIELTPQRVGILPFPNVSEELREKLDELVNLAGDGVAGAEDEINLLVAKCYGLSENKLRDIHQFLTDRNS